MPMWWTVPKVCCVIVPDMLIRYTLDVMHMESNVTDNILCIVLGENDMFGIREDMREVHICPFLGCKINQISPGA